MEDHYDMGEDWQKWVQWIAGIIVVLAGWTIADLIRTAEVRSAFETRLKSTEETVKHIREIVDQLSIESASTHNAVSQLDSIMKQINANVETRTASVVGLQAAINEIHHTVEIAASGQANNLKEVSRIINELGRQICTQQQCNHLQQEIDRTKR